MAKLVPNCSHVLHFSNEEVEYLQKIVTKYKDETYKNYFKEALDPSVFEKYPPYDLSKSQNSSIKIHLDEEIILDKFRMFHVHAEDGTEFSRTYPFFAYILLLTWYEKLNFPPIELGYYDCYEAITYSLYTMVYRWKPKDCEAKIFTYFRDIKEIKDRYSPNLTEIGSIFEAIEHKPTINNQKLKRSTQQLKNCSLQ